MSNTAQLLPNVFQTWLDANGRPLAAGQLFSYVAGTSTPQATYTDETAVTPNANPVVLNSVGVASVWLRTDLSYKLVLKDSSNNVLWTTDNVNIVNPASIDKTKIAANIANGALAQNGDGSISVQVDNSTIQINGSNNLAVKDSAITFAKINNAALIEVVFGQQFDCLGYGIKAFPQYQWSSPSKITVGTNPTGTCADAAWSPNGEFLAIANSGASPYVEIYQRIGTTLTKLPDPGTLPNGGCTGVKWSPDSQFIALGVAASPYVQIYQRSGCTFTLITPLNTTPANTDPQIAFSPNGEFLATCAQAQSGLIYQLVGTTWTSISGSFPDHPGSGSGIPPNDAGWSPDGQFLTYALGSSPYIWTYQRAGVTFTQISNPSSLPAGAATGIAWSPDQNFFVMTMSVSPYIAIYSVSGTTFTKLSNPSTLPGGACYGVSWSPNSQYFAVGSGTTPYVLIYQYSAGPTFTTLSNPVSLPAGRVNKPAWSPNGQFLACAENVSTYLECYKTSGTLSSSGILWTRSVLNV